MIEHLNSDNYEKENYVGKLRNEKKNLNNSAKGTFDDEAKSGNNKGQSNKLDSFTKKNEDNGKVKTSCGSMDSKHNAKDNVEKQDNFVEKVVQTSARINVSGQSEPMKQLLIQSIHYLEDDIAYDQGNSISGYIKNKNATTENSYKEVNHVDGQIEPKRQFIESIHYLEDDSAYDQGNLIGGYIKNKNATENSFKEVNHGQGRSRGEDKNSDDSAKEKYKIKSLKNKFDEQFLTLSSERLERQTTNIWNTLNQKNLQTKIAEDKVTTGAIEHILHLELLFTFHR